MAQLNSNQPQYKSSRRARLFLRLLSLSRPIFDKLTLDQIRLMVKSSRFPLPRGTTVQRLDEVPAQWITTKTQTSPGMILYLHGGGYALSTPKVHHPMLARLSALTKMRVLYLDYRLAPENPFPAALEDVLQVYQWLLTNQISPSSMVLAGDSAGGGLAIAAMVKFREMGVELPWAAVLLSPWCDLSLNSPTALSDRDPVYSRRSFVEFGKMYAGHTSIEHPMVSPIHADLEGLPPLLIQAGKLELLRDDAEGLAMKARQAGVKVELALYPGMWHAWQIYPPALVPESGLALQQISAFIARHYPARLD